MPAQTPLPTPLDGLDDRYRCDLVATPRGDFAVGSWEPGVAAGGRTVLALHGISSNHLLWAWAAAACPDVRILAMDLRGRGGSTRQGPFGLATHRQDVLAVADALELDRVVLAGMSMGGFVATAVASAAPERIESVLLVDGGFPFALPDDPEPLLRQLTDRGATETTFATVDDYTATYLSVLGAGLAHDDPRMRALMGWNLEGAPGSLSVKLPGDALEEDGTDTFLHAPTGEWLTSLQMPVHLLHVASTAGQMEVDRWAPQVPHLSTTAVLDADHASIIMGPRGGCLVAEGLRGLVHRDARATA